MDHTKYLIVHDSRLQGQAPGFYGGLLTIQLNATISLQTAFARINATARTFGKLKSLFLLCHGMAGSGLVYGNTNDFLWRGGGGLLLGQEQVHMNNVNLWTAIRNQVEAIVVYACGAAYTGPASPLGIAGNSDGRALMSALARHANATVYAADKIQWYYANDMDFGQWEGNVYMFPSAGGWWAGVSPPTEVSEVM